MVGLLCLAGYISWITAYFGQDIPGIIEQATEMIPVCIKFAEEHQVPLSAIVKDNYIVGQWGWAQRSACDGRSTEERKKRERNRETEETCGILSEGHPCSAAALLLSCCQACTRRLQSVRCPSSPRSSSC